MTTRMRSANENVSKHGYRRRVWTLDRPGTRLTYTSGGAGPAVLLIQGIGMTGGGWHPQVSALADRFEVVAFNSRGADGAPVDESTMTVEMMARDALAIMNARRIRRFHVVGQSMGGLVAQELALIAPDRVTSLSLVSSFASGAQATHRIGAITGLRGRFGSRRMRRHAALELFVSRSMLDIVPRDLLAEYMRLVLGRDLADQPRLIAEQLRLTSGYDASDRLSLLAPIPTLVIGADEDRIATREATMALAAAIPGARHVEIRGASHGVAIQCARVINQLLAEHFDNAERPRLLASAC